MRVYDSEKYEVSLGVLPNMCHLIILLEATEELATL